MFGSENVKVLSYLIDADPTGEETFHLMKAPRALTVLAVRVVSELTMNDGTAWLIRLENWGTSGTAVEGTISANVGGTAAASVLTALTPVAATLTTAQARVDAGEWLVLHYTEEGAGWVTGDRINVVIEYVDGLGA